MFWDPVFQRVSEASGAGPDQCKLIFCLIVSFPLANLFVRLPASKPNLQHIFSLALTTFFLWPFLGLGKGYLELLLSCAATYIICATVSGPRMPWIVFFVVMAQLTVAHLRRTIFKIPIEAIEISGSQMVLVMKLTTFAWNIHDGRQKLEELDESQKATRLTQLPGPLPFLGYCLFFPTVLVGPSFDYATYNSMITKTIYQTPIPGSSAAQVQQVGRRTPKGRRRVAYLHMALGLVFLGLYAVLGGRGDFHRILGDDWKSWGLATRFGFVQFCGFVARTKYYAVWSLAEGACILTGIGFNGYDPRTGRTLWNRVRNINILSLECAESFKMVFDNWNCGTNVWLRDSVYKRLAKKGQKPGAKQSMATFVTSAFWHGTAPGYYLAFVTAGIYQYIGKQFRRLIRPYFLPASSPGAANSLPKWPYPNLAKRAYDVVGWAVVQTHLNYVVAAFFILDFWPCLVAWTRCFWYGHVTSAIVIITLINGGRRFLRKGLKPREPKRPVPTFEVTPASPSEEFAPEESSAAAALRNKTKVDEDSADGEDTDLEWVRHDISQETSYRDGMPDGIMDDVLGGFETPRSGTPKPKMA